jgi:uncharacterized protein with HEPN domain
MSDKERQYILFLEDIQTAIVKIEKYTEGLSLEGFCNFEMAVDAVLRNLEVIGEAVKNIPEGVKNRYREVEWKEAVGFRNVLAHDYFGIDMESVWDTLKNNLPAFKEHIANVLECEKSEDNVDKRK